MPSILGQGSHFQIKFNYRLTGLFNSKSQLTLQFSSNLALIQETGLNCILGNAIQSQQEKTI